MMIKSWMPIAAVTILVAIAVNRQLKANDIRWFNRLRRPQWLTFERAIPLIWDDNFYLWCLVSGNRLGS
jgi:benzodiazapine receptor